MVVTQQLKKKLFIRCLMIVPPILFLLYSGHGLMVIRSLLSSSSQFHLDFANDLVQEYLSLEMNFEREQLRNCIAKAASPCDQTRFLTLKAEGAVIDHLEDGEGNARSLYLKESLLAQSLPAFFQSNKGLSSLFSERFHEPVYWFQILDLEERPIFQSAKRPDKHSAFASYVMDRSLKGHRIEIIYNTFGAQQLYSVARTKINFAAIFFLFILAIFSALLVTRSISQKIHLAKQKSFFVSTVSHEFKTPLAIMKLAVETLESKRFRSEEEEGKFRAMLINEINRLNHLVHKILSFNKIEMGQIHFHATEVDLREVLQPSLDVFRARALADGVDLHVDFCEKPCVVHGDGPLIRHAIDNLLDNAFKYRGDSKRIELTCTRGEKEVSFSIKDHGIGIAQEELPHIQKSFYRVDDPNTKGIRGSGLGLAISGYILKRADAAIAVASELGKGSTFTVTFPLVQPS